MKLILGSQSKWRKEVLERMGYKFAEAAPHLTPRPENRGSAFEVMVADIDEKVIRFDDPKKLTLALANAKADALLPKIKEDAILITADHVEVCNGEIREKPEDAEQAKEFLRSYNKYPVESVTAVVVANTANKKRREGVEFSKVYFNHLTDEKIDELVDSGCVFTCAGGYCINDPVFEGCIARVEGEVENVAGLPKVLTERLIKEVQS